jgi:uncharacterized membrane protein
MKKDSMAGFSKTQLLPTLHVCLYKLRQMSLGTEISAVVLCQHIPLILITVIFFFCDSLKNKIYNSKPRSEELKEDICREIANIPAEQL